MILKAELVGIDKDGNHVNVAEVEISSAKEYSDKEIINLEVYKRIIPVILLEKVKDYFIIMKLQSVSKDYLPHGYGYSPKGTIKSIHDYDMLKELLG